MVIHTDFIQSTAPEPHRARTRRILAQHPEIRELSGPNPWTFAIICGGVAIQCSIALSIREFPWWGILITAYTIGAVVNHTLWVTIHECAHRLVFQSLTANRLAAIFANLPMAVPSASFFERYHLRHHSDQGVYDIDVDLPNHWEARLFGGSKIGKAMWLLLFPAIMTVRPLRMSQLRFFNGWTVANTIIVFAFDALVVWLWGVSAFAYFVASLAFSLGLHPLGARWIQEHYVTQAGQETYSYYGWMNSLQLNIGYHNEHHDFPSVAWNNLPKVKRLAPEMYESLAAYRSWTRLLLHFLFSPSVSLYSRVVRAAR